jgi:hypothetical protein
MQDMQARQGKRAGLVQTREFVCVSTQSGRGLLRRDPQGVTQTLDVGAPDSELGSAIVQALAKSRFLSSEEARAFFDKASNIDDWEAWVRFLMTKYGYPSRKALFQQMKSCDVRRVGDAIEFLPSRHVESEAWEALDPSEALTINADATADEIGAAARIALQRCAE